MVILLTRGSYFSYICRAFFVANSSFQKKLVASSHVSLNICFHSSRGSILIFRSLRWISFSSSKPLTISFATFACSLKTLFFSFLINTDFSSTETLKSSTFSATVLGFFVSKLKKTSLPALCLPDAAFFSKPSALYERYSKPPFMALRELKLPESMGKESENDPAFSLSDFSLIDSGILTVGEKSPPSIFI